MTLKRPTTSADTDCRQTKQFKTEFPLEIKLEGVEYINLSSLFKSAPYASYYAKHYNSNEAKFTEDEKLEVFYVSKKNVQTGVFKRKPQCSNRHDLRLVRKSMVQAFMERVDAQSPPLAPPIILADEMDFFFADDAGNTHKVEMRGERLQNGIYLKAKDIGNILGHGNLSNGIQASGQLEEGEDYVWFTIPIHEREKFGHGRELFLTYTGMLALVFQSKLPIAKKFRKWVSDVVFVHHLGTEEQKGEAGRSLLNKKMIDEIAKRCEDDISCVYLIETERVLPCDSSGQQSKIYKFGYSKKMNERMGKLVVEHGRNCVIDTLIFLPVDYLSQAEKNLKDFLGTKYRYAEGTATELLLLSGDERKSVQAAMRNIGKAFNGSTVVRMQELDTLKKNHEQELDMLKKDHAHTLQLCKMEHDFELWKVRANCEAELAKKERDFLEKTTEAQARRIQDLESNRFVPSGRQTEM
ncbi:hypothetical protein HDU96_008142 [Phlyctochytrium bullatum]|nr:hypothetical protein HDU96_008142 [Phlyctochytrium bullatum]